MDRSKENRKTVKIENYVPQHKQENNIHNNINGIVIPLSFLSKVVRLFCKCVYVWS